MSHRIGHDNRQLCLFFCLSYETTRTRDKKSTEVPKKKVVRPVFRPAAEMAVMAVMAEMAIMAELSEWLKGGRMAVH